MNGNVDKVKGKLKQAAGDLNGNKKLHDEGKIDELAGKAKDGLDEIKGGLDKAKGGLDKAKGGIDKVKKKITPRR